MALCRFCLFLLNTRLEQSNAARMSAAGEGLTEPNLYLRLTAQMQTSLATRTKFCTKTRCFSIAHCIFSLCE